MNQKEEFIKAISNDEYAEWEISDQLVLITDWEGDGYFNPYVLDLECQYSKDEIDHILWEVANDVFDFQVLEFDKDEDNSYDLYYPQGIKCEYVNHPYF